MTTSTTSPTLLDRLTSRATAFRSWTALLGAIASGYLPTLSRSYPTQVELGSILEAGGRPVYWIR